MQPTEYHAKYYAYLLTQKTEHNKVKRLAPACMGADIEFYAHQIGAALFALRSPFHKGVVLADEEGMGKTVEACIALAFYMAEGRDKLIVCAPEWLQQHWVMHLHQLFGLQVVGLDEYPQKAGVVLLTVGQAIENANKLAQIPWDLCVIDEAHRVAASDSFTGSKPTGTALARAFKGRKTILITSTPLPNGWLDLFYLLRFVDDTAFGSDVEVYEKKYVQQKTRRRDLLERARKLCYRTLRKNTPPMKLARRQIEHSSGSGDSSSGTQAKPLSMEKRLSTAKPTDEWTELKRKAETDMLSYFDESTARRFGQYVRTLRAWVLEMERVLFELTNYKLNKYAVFSEEERAFKLKLSPYEDLPMDDSYLSMERHMKPSQRYRLGHPLAKRIIECCLNSHLGNGMLMLEGAKGFSAGLSGVLGLWGVSAFADDEEFESAPLLCGITREGNVLFQRQCEAILNLKVSSCNYGGRVLDESTRELIHYEYVSGKDKALLEKIRDRALRKVKEEMQKRMDVLLEEEIDKIRRCYDDEMHSLDMRRKEMKRHIRPSASHVEGAAMSYAESFALQKRIVQNELKRRRIEQDKKSAEEKIEKNMEERLNKVREKASLWFKQEELFLVRFVVI